MQPKHTHIICSFLFLMLANLSFSQDSGGNIFQQELNKMAKMPNSPEAQAFATYGDVDVSLYTGTPNISIPLHEISGREMTLPMSLTYNASGIKVEQLATWTGLGWNLNLGGRISRVANGLPDDYIDGNYETMNDTRKRVVGQDPTIGEEITASVNSYLENRSKRFLSEQAVRDYFFFLDKVNKNFIDTQPDIFEVNAPGLNTTLVFDPNDDNKPKSLDNPRIRIDQVYRGSRGNYEILGWVITGEDGTRYTFGVANNNSSLAPKYELTKSYGNDNQENGVLILEYASSWVLTKIESPNKKDVFEFDYYDTGYWLQPAVPSQASKAGLKILDDKDFYSLDDVSERFSLGAGYWTSQLLISEVKHNSKVLVELNRGTRNDLPYDNNVNARLDHILFYDYNAILLKRIDLNNNNYFNQGAVNSFDKRLKLDKVVIKDKLQNSVEEYVLDYHSPELLPSRLSKGQDYGGYYNGVNNSVLYPKYQNSGLTFDGADRDPSYCHTQIGTLKKITYPTGGYTEFNYELNQSELAPQDTSSEEWTDIPYAQLSVSAGTDPSTPCGPCCLDQFGSSPPKVVSVTFSIEEAGNYNIDYIKEGLGGNMEQAFIMQLSDGKLCSNPDAGPFTLQPLPYDEIVSNSCVWDDRIVWNHTYPVDKMYFARGCYQVTLVIGNQSNNNLNLQIWRPELQTNLGADGALVDRPGLRIKSVVSRDSNGDFAKSKSYSYPKQKNNHIPILSKIVNVGSSTFLERTAGYQQGDGPMISYPEVIESSFDAFEIRNGKIKYTFYSNSGGRIPHEKPPFQINYFPKLISGKLKKSEVYNKFGIPVSNQTIEYYQTIQSPVSINGLVVSTNLNNAEKYPFISQGINDFGYELVERNCRDEGQGAGQDTTKSWNQIITATNAETQGLPEDLGDGRGGTTDFSNACPFPCINNWENCSPYIGLMDNFYGRYEVFETFINGDYGGISMTKNVQFFEESTNNTNEVSTLTETEYDKTIDGYYRPKEVKTVNSKGDIYRQSFTYPNYEDDTYAALFNKNRLNEVVNSQTEKVDENGNLLRSISARKNEYYISGNVIMPSKIFATKEGPNDLEERVNFTYYSDGNLKTAKKTNGVTTVYIWGYDNKYPLAKVENAAFDDVSGYVTTLKSKSNADDDRTFNTAGNEGSLRQSLDDLRTALPNAMVSTYTYDPLIGVTSMTDPRGYTIYYEYDDFNRLKLVKDAAGKLVSDYEYGYKQPVSN